MLLYYHQDLTDQLNMQEVANDFICDSVLLYLLNIVLYLLNIDDTFTVFAIY